MPGDSRLATAASSRATASGSRGSLSQGMCRARSAPRAKAVRSVSCTLAPHRAQPNKPGRQGSKQCGRSSCKSKGAQPLHLRVLRPHGHREHLLGRAGLSDADGLLRKRAGVAVRLLRVHSPRTAHTAMHCQHARAHAARTSSAISQNGFMENLGSTASTAVCAVAARQLVNTRKLTGRTHAPARTHAAPTFAAFTRTGTA